MQPIATDGVAWSVCVSVCSCIFVSPLQTAEAIHMRLEGWLYSRLNKPCIRWGRNLSREGTILGSCTAH